MRHLVSVFILFVFLVSAYPGDPMPAIFLNHIAVVIDQASYDALRSSPQVAILAEVHERHVVSGNRNWSGFYMDGRQTYIEFFGTAAPPDGMHLGDSQFNLSVEEPGGVLAIAARLRTTFKERVEVVAVPRSLSDRVVPWFTGTGIKGPGLEAMDIGFMEFDPGYLVALHPGSPVEHPLMRQQYMSWDFRPERPLDDLVGITAALNPSDMAQLATELELVGWAVQRGGRGLVALGPDVKLTVVPAGTRSGIQQAELRLRHSVPKQDIALGSASLLLEGNTGRFVFWAPN
jgi:hypothetical protein